MDRRKLRDAARDMQNDFQQAGDASGRALSQGITSHMPEVEKALDRATAASGRFLVEQQKLDSLMSKSGDNRDKIIAQSERVSVAYRKESSALREVETALQAVTPSAGGATESLAEVGSTLGKLGKLGGPLVFAGLAAGLVELTGVASAASGAIGLLPGAIGGAASAFGTLKLATVGFSDALDSINDPEKFAEAIAKLSPNAQQAALSIQQLMPAFTQLKNATQDALFAGVGPQLQQMTTTLLPIVQQTTTSIAASFNEMFRGITNQLMTPETVGALAGFGKNIGDAFRALTPAVAPLTQAFAQIAQVGSGFMPELASAASQAAQSFANFIREASQSGQLQQWIQDGITVMRQMMSVVGELGRAFFALAPEGMRAMNDIKTSVDLVSEAVRLLSGDVTALKDVFPSVGDFAVNTFNRINAAINMALGPLRAVISAANSLPGVNIPQIPDLQQATTPTLSGGPLGGPPAGGPGGSVAYPSGDPNRPMQWVPGQGWMPAGPGGALPLPTAGADHHGVGGSPGRTWQSAVPGSNFGMGQAVPDPKKGPAGPGGRLGQAPAVPYNTSLPPGFENLPQTPQLYSAESSYMDANTALQEKRARLDQLERNNTATATDIQSARNDVITAERSQHEAELRLYDARNSLYEKNNKQLAGYADQMGEIGAQLDKDLGISKGLPGIADNLVRFLASLAAAPLMGQLNAMANAPGQAQGGYGLMGVLGAQGAFGPQYTAAGQAAASSSGTSPSAMGPTGLQPSVGGSNVNAMFALAQGASGRTKYGPASDLANGLADCSGSISDLVEVLQTGQSSPARLFDTTAFATDAGAAKFGFQPGYMPGALNVGVNPYPGQSGHMAATLPNGVNFEGGGGTGGGGQYGGSASGALDPQFEKHYFLPVGAGGPAGIPVGAGVPGAATSSGVAAAGGPSFPIPLPVTIVGGAGGGIGLPGLGAPGQTPGQPGTDLYGPANTSPGLNNPPAPGGPPGAPLPPPGTPGFAGTGMPFGLQQPSPTQIGGVDPLQGTGKGALGVSDGLMGAAMTAAGGLDMIAPGMGQVAQTGMKLANRAIQYGGQVAGIMTQGALDTFLPFGGSKLAQNGWLTKIVGGLAGAAPALPNMAGKNSQKPDGPQQGAPGPEQGAAPAPGVTNNLTVNNNRQTEDGTGKDLTRHLNSMYAPAGMP